MVLQLGLQEKHMRTGHSIATGLVFGLVLSGASFAAYAAGTQTAPAATPVKAPAVEVSCEKTGSEVSALLDSSATSPNIAAARAMFQVGIMDCMEGQPEEAIKHYEDAKKLLSADRPAAPAKPAKS
jgi:hypothetical protein